MAFVGNAQGPRESDILEMLGREPFGLAIKQFEDEIFNYEDEESRGEVTPAFMDEQGFYLRFSGPCGPWKFYLKKHGYKLTGAIQVRLLETT